MPGGRHDHRMGGEGYPGLLTHGPLQALAMAEAPARPGYVLGR